MQLPRVWHLTPHLFPILCAVGRKQFMRFEWANHAAEALGCDYEELNTATFKHHLRQIIEQMTSGPQRQGLQDNEACSGIESSRLHYGGLDLAVAALVAAPHAFPCFLMFSKTPFECSVHMCRNHSALSGVYGQMVHSGQEPRRPLSPGRILHAGRWGTQAAPRALCL